MVGGIVFTALSVKQMIAHTGRPIAIIPASALCGGIASISHAGIDMDRVQFRFRYYESGYMPYLGMGRRRAIAVDLREFCAYEVDSVNENVSCQLDPPLPRSRITRSWR
jgi:hypothetical protein